MSLSCVDLNESKLKFNFDDDKIMKRLFNKIEGIFLFDEGIAARQIYNQLEGVNIVFRDVQSAIRHINNVAKEPQKWWVLNEVQKARKQFCELHSRKSNRPIDTLSKLFF